MKNPKNIMHVFGSMDYGGAEITTINMMDETRYLFKDVYFCTTSGKRGILAESLEAKGYRIIPCSIYSLKFPLIFFKILREHKIDIIHTHISIVSGYIALLAFLAGVKRRIVHFRSSKIGKSNSVSQKLKVRVLMSLIYLFSTDILAVNKSTMINHFKNYKSIERCRVIYNGKNSYYVNDERRIKKLKNQLMIHENEKVIIHIGRFFDAKNHKKIVKIFSEYNKMMPNSKLLLIGKNNTEIGEEIKKVVGSLELDDSVIFLGIKDNIADYLAISDILLFPSLWEGLPGVVLEALSAGVPVLCSDIDCHREITQTNYGISMLSNNEEDRIWANQLKIIADIGKQKKISDNFISSPYYVENIVYEFVKLYEL